MVLSMTPPVTTPAPAMVVSDLDGTLLGPDHTVSRRNAAALARAAEAGARVVIATGRAAYNLNPVLDIGFTGLAVCMNGAVTYDIARGEVRSATWLQPLVMQEFTADLISADIGFGLAVERAIDNTRDFWADPDYFHPWGDITIQQTSREELLSGPAVKMYVRYGTTTTELFDTIRAIAAGRVSTTDSSGDGLVEVAASGVTKASALEEIATGWGLDASQVVAFGDMPNDLEMLRWAGHSVAMSNGHAHVRAVATEVGGHHAEDGVAEVLERWF